MLHDGVPTPVQTSLVVASAALFGVALALRALARGWRAASLLVVALAMVLGAGGLVWHAALRGGWFPVEDNFEALGWVGIMLAACVIYVQFARPVTGLDWFVYPIVILLLLGAAYFGHALPHHYGESAWSTAHIFSAYAGSLSLAIAAAAGALYLYAHARLRTRSPLTAMPVASLERLEATTQHALTLGWPLFTIGLVTGVLWGIHKASTGQKEPGTFFVPKVLLAVGAWTVFALALHTPINPSFRGRKSAVLSLIGLLLMAGTLVAVQYMPGGAWLMQSLILLGLNHTTAPLAVREKLAFNSDEPFAAIAHMRRAIGAAEAVLLSTCNRVEFYLVSGDGSREAGALFSLLVKEIGELRNIAPDEFVRHLYMKEQRAAVEHLFAVASSLDSMVLGETQILGQVRQAYEESAAAGAVGTVLHPLFQQAIATGKQVMTQTPLARGRRSVASVAVEYARRIFDTFSDKTVLSIGAGKMGELVVSQFAGLRPGRLIVCNRDARKAIMLANECGGEAVGMEQLTDHLVAADIVITGTGSTHPIITRKLFDAVLKRRRYKPVFLIDMALPRDVEASVGEADHVYLYNLDDLQQVISASEQNRFEGVDAAQAIVAQNVAQYLVAHRARELGPLIERLYRQQHEIARVELERMIGRMPAVSETERSHLEEFARRLVNKLLHDPVRALRNNTSAHATPAQYAHALEMLYGLGDAFQGDASQGDASQSDDVQGEDGQVKNEEGQNEPS